MTRPLMLATVVGDEYAERLGAALQAQGVIRVLGLLATPNADTHTANLLELAMPDRLVDRMGAKTAPKGQHHRSLGTEAELAPGLRLRQRAQFGTGGIAGHHDSFAAVVLPGLRRGDRDGIGESVNQTKRQARLQIRHVGQGWNVTTR